VVGTTEYKVNIVLSQDIKTKFNIKEKEIVQINFERSKIDFLIVVSSMRSVRIKINFLPF